MVSSSVFSLRRPLVSAYRQGGLRACHVPGGRRQAPLPARRGLAQSVLFPPSVTRAPAALPGAVVSEASPWPRRSMTRLAKSTPTRARFIGALMRGAPQLNAPMPVSPILPEKASAAVGAACSARRRTPSCTHLLLWSTTCAFSSRVNARTSSRHAGQARRSPDQEESDPDATSSNRPCRPRPTTVRACLARASSSHAEGRHPKRQARPSSVRVPDALGRHPESPRPALAARKA